MAHAFRRAAKEDLALIALGPTLTRGGITTRTRVWRRGRGDEYRQHYALPNLAVAVADARFCYTLGLRADGGLSFSDSLRRRSTYTRGVIDVATALSLPPGYEEGRREVATFSGAWAAMVPIVPPKLRPRNGHVDLAASAPRLFRPGLGVGLSHTSPVLYPVPRPLGRGIFCGPN